MHFFFIIGVYTFIESWKYVCVCALKPDIFDAGNNPKIDKFTWGVHRGVETFPFPLWYEQRAIANDQIEFDNVSMYQR